MDDPFSRWWGRNIVGRLGRRVVGDDLRKRSAARRLFQAGSAAAERLSLMLPGRGSSVNTRFMEWRRKSLGE
jgi:hypothetical protein